MGLFKPSRAFSEMRTEEERYRSSGHFEQQSSRASRALQQFDDRIADTRRREVAQQAAKEKRGRVKKVGTLRRIGRNKWQTGGWQIDGVQDGRYEGAMGGFTVKELCAMAHGSRCRCTC
jgi:hypothetical protein